jgi:outer membrane translocation and assembly module TamA
MKSVLDPYLPVLQQYNIRPDAQVADMMQAHYTLAFGTPEEKLDLVQRIAKDYGIPLNQQAVADTPVWIDPQVEALQKELQAIKSTLSKTESAQIERQKAEITQHVQAFASDPKNVYFDELANDIAHLLSTGAEKSIESAYEAAIWRNPVTRAKEITRQQTEQAEALRKTEQERVKAAKEATEVNVRSKAKTRGAATPVGTIDDTLNETLATIMARTN